ncbi:GNAT family N-acetyltransferase [Nocardia sp. CDC160]|uniref:GNAT family N-acetyltransferase n=1 Tax=Nocardia sp. CDC160 TaxID=3112166 RepID=UPI002DB8E9F7|nr:GNAT family N-acetyltransferase [Nocardia sp. CDC160]MEC3918952.1 GNAT family N-acetyltransferase [Nocardia sp. CDC160]
MRPVIREFEKSDLDAVVALSLRAWAPVFASLENVLGESGVFSLLHADWRADQERAVRATCQTEGMRVWVAEIDSAVAGFVAARLHPGLGEVYMIAVDPDQQRRGLGGALTEAAIEWFEDEEVPVAMVETGGDPGHAPARRTYERAGFTQLPVARYFKKL